jgi:hypothetical protein
VEALDWRPAHLLNQSPAGEEDSRSSIHATGGHPELLRGEWFHTPAPRYFLRAGGGSLDDKFLVCMDGLCPYFQEMYSLSSSPLWYRGFRISKPP